MSEQLLPCPFCGGKARYMLADLDDDGYCVECQQCWASSRVHLSLMDDARPIVAAAWNRRVPAPAAGVPVEVADYIQYALNRAWHNVDEYAWLTDEEKAKRRAPIDAALKWLASVTQQPQPGQAQGADE